MATDEPQTPATTDSVDDTPTETVVVRERRSLAGRVAKWLGVVIAVLGVLVVGAMLGINTGPGRDFLARQLSNYTLESGLNVRVGRIDGSIYGAMVLRDVQVRDSKGTFASADELALDWRPFEFLSNHVDIRSLTSPLVRLDRLPELKPTPSDPNAPTLPNIAIDVAKLDIARIEIGSAITGQRHIATLKGKAHLAGGRAQIDADAGTLAGPGIAGGDRALVKIDAVPDRNQLDIDMRLNGPAGGFITGLAGLDKPVTLAVGGKGSWSNWNGKAVGTLGGETIADLTVAARSGTYSVRGTANPGLYMEGPVERLGAPRVEVALDVAWNDRRADTKLHLRSKALDVTANGMLDFAQSQFGNFRTEAMLLTPGAIADNVNGRDVRFSMLLNGQFARPVVDYKLQAASLGFGEMRAERLYAEGKARVDADRILVPVKARAARVAGLNAAVGGLVTNLTIDGDLAISGDQILSDNLKLRSDRIAATAVVVADISEGRYTGALKGRVNDYEIDGIGVVNLTTDAKLYAAPGGGWGIRGQVAGQSARIYSDGVREFLGGNAVASAQVGFDQNGIITFSNVRMNAPKFRVTNGSGRYDPKGALALTADAVSTEYGPITARVTGSLTAPTIALRVARPGLGIGLVDLEAVVKGTPSGAYAIDAKGGTDYGPFTANVLIETANRLAVEIRAARFAGMDITGRIQQTAAGPFEGRVDFSGSGVKGNARLSAQGELQRADFDARATNAQIPGMAALSIGRAIVTGSVVLADTPEIVADAQVAALRSGAFTVKTARVKVNYKGSNGTAQAYIDGSSGVPFNLAVNARLNPNEWLVALNGRGSGVGFRTPDGAPARIALEQERFRLLPTRLNFDRGTARIAGTYGDGMSLQLRVDQVDLAVVNALVPGLGVGGKATGSVDFAQAEGSDFPTANMRIEVSDFTRASVSQVSETVNMILVGKLGAGGAETRALIRRGSTTVGRVVANLRPVPGGPGSWTERLMAAPLSGGLRYNGPGSVLFSLAGLAGQHVEGPVGIAADFSGSVQSPDLRGVVRASNLTYENETFGTRLSKMSIDGRFTDDQLVINDVSAVAGDGTLKAKGTIGLSSSQGFPMDVTADFNNARLARSESLGATATGQIRVIRDSQGNRIQGRLDIPEARYEIVLQGAADVPVLTGVRRKTDVFETQEQRAEAEKMGLWNLDLRVSADNQLFVSGMGLESEWRATMFVRGTSAAPRITGSAEVVRGTYEFAGRRFTLSRGNVNFQGSQLTNPTIDIAATTTAEGVTAILNISGTAQQPRISFTSTPSLPQEEVLSRILFGSSVTNLSAVEALQLASSLNSLRGGGGGLNPLGKLRSATGIDRLRVLAADDKTGRGTALAAGQYITDDIYIEVITDARGFAATQLEVALTKSLSILSQTGSFGGSSVSLRYSRDY
ncbi:MAG: translocation/assembly module TamB domain-containing protein [Sphingomonas sp.]